MEKPEKPLSIQEIAARKLIVGEPSIYTIRRMIGAKKIKALNVGAGTKQGRWRIELQEIDRFNKNILEG